MQSYLNKGQLAPILGRVAGAHKSSARTEKLLLFICIFVSFFFFIGEKAKEWKISVLKPMGKPDLRVPWICLIMNDTDKRQMSVEPPPPAWRYSSRASAYKEAHSHENFGIFIETSRRNSCWRHEDGDSINVFTVNIQTGIDCLRVAYADTAFAFDSCTTERSMPEGRQRRFCWVEIGMQLSTSCPLCSSYLCVRTVTGKIQSNLMKIKKNTFYVCDLWGWLTCGWMS